MHVPLNLPLAIITAAMMVTGTLLIVTGVSPHSPSDYESKTASVIVQAPLLPTQLTADEASIAVKEFVTAATTDYIAQAFPDNATPDTFAAAVSLIDAEAPSARVVSALSDFALLKISTPSSEISVDIDSSKVLIVGNKATVPNDAVIVKVDGVPVSNSGELASQVGHLKYAGGKWTIAFPDADPTPTPAPATKK